MNAMEPKNFEEYLGSGGCRCPYCGSTDISGSSFDIDQTGVRQAVLCDECLSDWVDVYTLSGFIEADGTIIEKPAQ